MLNWKWLAAAAFALMGAGAAAQVAPGPGSPRVAVKTAAAPIPSTPTVAQTEAPELSKADVDAWLDGALPYAMRVGDVAGGEVVVVKHGKVLTARGFGFADVAKRIPVDPARTLFRPASVSKLFTATAVMQQLELGKLDLDRDVNTYLDFKIPPYQGKPITLRQLLTHTAGFEEASKYVMFYDKKYLVSLGDYLKRWTPRRIYAPGTTPAYSNYGYALAGYIVERVSGEPYDSYVEKHILTPLGMTNSTFRQPLPARFAGQLSKGYVLASGKAAGFEILGPAPAGALSTTGTDMAKFMLAHLNEGELDGRRILRAETAHMMHDTPLTLLPPLNRMELGFFETNINGRQVITHLGDTPTFHTALHLFEKEGVGIYISFNSTGKEAAGAVLRGALFESFSDRYFPAAPAPARIAKIDQKTTRRHAEMLAGTWEVSRRSRSNFMAALGLAGQLKISVGPDGELLIPVAKGLDGQPRKWVEVAPFVWQDDEGRGHERLAAKIVDGRAVRFSIDGLSPFMVFDRVPASRSSAWLVPAALASLAALFLTFILWPVRAVVRRRFGASLPFTGRDLGIYRGTRVAAGLTLALMIGWITVISLMAEELDYLTSRMDGWLWFLQTATLVILVGGLAIAVVHLVRAWRTHRWPGKIWSIALVLSQAALLWLAYSYGLLAFSVNY